jgi:F-box-like
MSTLPLELIFIIFHLVNKADLKSLRLVSRRFKAIATSILFLSVSASPHDEDLEALQFVADHPVLRTLVQEIVYFEVYFHRGRWAIHKTHDIRRYQKVRSWKTDAFKDPTWDPDTHIDIIAKALSRMPNIRRVILRNHWCAPRDIIRNPRSYRMEEIDQAVSGPRSSRNYRMSIEGRPFPWAAGRHILSPDTCGFLLWVWGYVRCTQDFRCASAGVCHRLSSHQCA